MNAVGWWTLSLAVGYTALLIALGRRAGRADARGGGYFVGGRGFRPITVAVCITGLFSGSSFIAITELSYRTGISAIWYGVAETIQILLIATLLVGPLRKRLVVTVSGMVGDRFGRGARALAGGITALTFPMWSVATAIAFASALHVITGIDISIAIVGTALLLLAYLWAGGMRSVAITQAANSIAFVVMGIVGVIAITVGPGWRTMGEFIGDNPEYGSIGSAGSTLIIAWFGTFIVNVILAQAAFQMSLSCRTPKEGRRGMLAAAGFGVPLLVLGVLLGVAAAIAVPEEQLGLVAVSRFVAEAVPVPLAALFFLGIWACALGLGAPCQFSGATSLGRDVGSALRPQATEEQLVRWTRWSLVVLTVLMIIFGFLRTEQSAWWNVLAWTLRNGATLAPVIGALFWPLATRKAAYAALSTGFLSGLAWYHLGDWQPNAFFSGVHPVWVGMSVNLVALVTVTLIETAGRSTITTDPRRRRWAAAALVGAGLVSAATWRWADWAHPRGVTGLLVFSAILLVTIAAAAAVTGRDTEGQVPGSDAEIRVGDSDAGGDSGGGDGASGGAEQGRREHRTVEPGSDPDGPDRGDRQPEPELTPA